MGEEQVTRLSVNMNKETSAALEGLAAQRGVSRTQIIRSAIALAKFFSDEQRQDRKIVVVDERGAVKKELLLV